MRTALVTGATGLVGGTLCRVLSAQGYRVRAARRTAGELPEGVAEQLVIGDISGETRWDAALEGVDTVCHLAGRTHMLSDTAAAGELYRRTNVLATQELATAAARAGVRRLVYVSSIKVNGEGGARAYTADDVPSPEDAYGRSKMQAELLLPQCAGSMEIAVVRPPLVYGPGVRANFLRLMEWIDHERPLPLGLVDNRRSLVSVWNVCDLIAVLATHPRAAGGTWLVSDGEDLSTPELIRRLAAALQRRSRLLPVPASLLRLAATLTGRRAEIERLCGSLTVDISRTREVLGWAPPVPVEAALMRTASWFHTHVR